MLVLVMVGWTRLRCRLLLLLLKMTTGERGRPGRGLGGGGCCTIFRCGGRSNIFPGTAIGRETEAADKIVGPARGGTGVFAGTVSFNATVLASNDGRDGDGFGAASRPLLDLTPFLCGAVGSAARPGAGRLAVCGGKAILLVPPPPASSAWSHRLPPPPPLFGLGRSEVSVSESEERKSLGRGGAAAGNT